MAEKIRCKVKGDKEGEGIREKRRKEEKREEKESNGK